MFFTFLWQPNQPFLCTPQLANYSLVISTTHISRFSCLPCSLAAFLSFSYIFLKMVTDFRSRIHFFLMVDDEKFQLRCCRELNEEKVSYFSQFTSPSYSKPVIFPFNEWPSPKEKQTIPHQKTQALLRLSHLLYNVRVFLSLRVTEELLKHSREYKNRISNIWKYIQKAVWRSELFNGITWRVWIASRTVKTSVI